MSIAHEKPLGHAALFIAQLPAPSHWGVVSWSPVHESIPQVVPLAGNAQAPALHCASSPHGGVPATQRLLGFEPSRAAPHVPSGPLFFVAALQAWQAVSHAVSQQTPSTQKVDVHCVPIVHVAPLPKSPPLLDEATVVTVVTVEEVAAPPELAVEEVVEVAAPPVLDVVEVVVAPPVLEVLAPPVLEVLMPPVLEVVMPPMLELEVVMPPVPPVPPTPPVPPVLVVMPPVPPVLVVIPPVPLPPEPLVLLPPVPVAVPPPEPGILLRSTDAMSSQPPADAASTAETLKARRRAV